MNTSNIVFLKSTDDSMLETLQKMSGTTHRVFKDSKSVTRDMERIMLQNEGKVTYNVSVKEMPVITYNDMAFISDRNSIVFRAGDSPMWNRNETILPMSWRLFSNTIIQPGKEYSLQTIPTLSSALDFDVRKNQPDFIAMWEKRKVQARMVAAAKEAYQKAYGYSAYDIEQLDPNVYADDIMNLVEQMTREKIAEEANVSIEKVDEMDDILADLYDYDPSVFEDNYEQAEATAEQSAKYENVEEKRYAGGRLSKGDLVTIDGKISHALDRLLIRAFRDCRSALLQDGLFMDRNDGNLYSRDGVLYIRKQNESQELSRINRDAKSKDARVFASGDLTEEDLAEMQGFEVLDSFYRFLASRDRWDFAGGKFEAAVAKIMSEDE